MASHPWISKFPGDNAVFAFDYGVDDASAPADPAAYGAWWSGQTKSKLARHAAEGGYHVFETSTQFRVTTMKKGVRLFCGGALHRGGEYRDFDKIPKERDAAIRDARAVCKSITVE